MNSYPNNENLSAEQIMAFDDEQLDEYLRAKGRIVTVKDPENLRETFIQRLRARTHNPKSQPIDPQQLFARLRDAPIYEARPARSPSPASTICFTEEEDREYARHLQSQAYHILVQNGGRPSHPIERLEDIVENPGELSEILSFWQHEAHSPESWAVFGPQRGRWHAFQNIQRHVRVGRFRYETSLFLAARDETLEKYILDFPESVHGAFSFPEYVQSAKARLARNGFMRTFELDADPMKQSKLTTWIEFLNWEYLHYEDNAHNANRRQSLHKKAWKKLVDSGVLKPGETEKVISTFEHGLQRSAARHSAEKAVSKIKRNLALAGRAMIPARRLKGFQEPIQQVNAVQADLDTAEEVLKRVRHRNECISEFAATIMNYRIYSENAERHLKLLRWMLQQIPLIEQELQHSDTTSSTPEVSEAAAEELSDGAGHAQPPHTTSSGGKRRRDQSDDGQRHSKKAKHQFYIHRRSKVIGAPIAGKPAFTDAVQSEPPPKPIRKLDVNS